MDNSFKEYIDPLYSSEVINKTDIPIEEKI